MGSLSTKIILMSAWVYSGPAQFAVLGASRRRKVRAEGVVAGLLMNLRFLPMSTALAPFFRGVKRLPLFISSHVISASSFIVPYLQFQKEQRASRCAGRCSVAGRLWQPRLFFSASARPALLFGSLAPRRVSVGAGFSAGLRRSDEVYSAGLFRRAAGGGNERFDDAADLSALASIAAIPGALFNPGWGWLATAIGAAMSWLGCGKVGFTRIEIILILGLMALCLARFAADVFRRSAKVSRNMGPFAALSVLRASFAA